MAQSSVEGFIKRRHFGNDFGVTQFVSSLRIFNWNNLTVVSISISNEWTYLHVEKSFVDGRNTDVGARISEHDHFDSVARLVLHGIESQREIVAGNSIDGDGETVGNDFAVLGDVIDDHRGDWGHFGAQRDRQSGHAGRTALRASHEDDPL